MDGWKNRQVLAIFHMWPIVEGQGGCYSYGMRRPSTLFKLVLFILWIASLYVVYHVTDRYVETFFAASDVYEAPATHRKSAPPTPQNVPKAQPSIDG